jgi:Cys-tRNA(Pro)/Cys-tRNA(Cys) deacylase
MAKRKKLNAMRWLEQRDIPYTTYEFDDSLHNAQDVAGVLGIPPAQIFKTLVVLTTAKAPLLVLVSGNCALNLKLLAAAVGEKKLIMAGHDEAEQLTGLQTGGISALALTAKNWPVYVEATATQFGEIYMSAGQRGINLRVPRQAFIDMFNAVVVACCSPLEDNL